MVRIISHEKGADTSEDMNYIANFLMKNGFAKMDDENYGFQEASTALCDYEVHVTRKREKQTTI